MDIRDQEAMNREAQQDIPNITRVEVIDENGRSYVNWKPTNKVVLQVQDEGRTLKVFISNDES